MCRWTFITWYLTVPVSPRLFHLLQQYELVFRRDEFPQSLIHLDYLVNNPDLRLHLRLLLVDPWKSTYSRKPASRLALLRPLCWCTIHYLLLVLSQARASHTFSWPWRIGCPRRLLRGGRLLLPNSSATIIKFENALENWANFSNSVVNYMPVSHTFWGFHVYVKH